MRTNPMVKPQTSSGWAVTLTVISCVCLAIAIRMFMGQPAASAVGMTFITIAVAFGGLATAIWLVRNRRMKAWIVHAVQQWEHFSIVKSQLGVTAEVTVLDIHSTDPLGAWVTIRWNKFGHMQPAWVEALPDEIWRDAVLLISPDPAQIQVHGPWPEIYYLRSTNYHAFAAAQALPYFRDGQYRSSARVNLSKA